jgi:hypothetical protein
MVPIPHAEAETILAMGEGAINAPNLWRVRSGQGVAYMAFIRTLVIVEDDKQSTSEAVK